MIHFLMSRAIFGSFQVFQVAKDYIKPTDKVVIVALSFFDSQITNRHSYQQLYEKEGEYYQKILNSFSPYKIQESQIMWIDYFDDDSNMAQSKIKQADIVYLPGGAPDLMMKRIKQMGIQEALENHTGVMIGSSAGTMIQFEDYYISKDNDYPCFLYQKGLSLLKHFFVEVHYRRRRRQKRAMKKVFRAYKKPILTIPDDGFILVTEEKIIPYHTARLHYYKKGIY
jgi:peptidase E